ncbi:MAG: methylmalonyl Co-A mutase-associated GTPase MeaB [Chloroflexota bacterium]
MKDVVDAALNGNRRAAARLLTQIENQRDGVEDIIAALFPHTGRAVIIGITGAPGTGKSSLVNAMAKGYRQQGKTVGIIAVDPTSPFSGGAILGDRIRMRDLSGDSGVFIRSMATRGSLGGLARATRDAIRVLDAAGFDVVLVETVGAGQSEVDIVRTAQTTLVVEAPGLGDDVQAIKAGILEIADVLVVNKADRAGVKNTTQSLKAMLELGHPASRLGLTGQHGRLITDVISKGDILPEWIPPIVQTIATQTVGVPELLEAIESHQVYVRSEPVRWKLDRLRFEIEIYERLRELVVDRLMSQTPDADISQIVSRVQSRELDPQRAAQEILKLYERLRSSTDVT